MRVMVGGGGPCEVTLKHINPLQLTTVHDTQWIYSDTDQHVVPASNYFFG